MSLKNLTGVRLQMFNYWEGMMKRTVWKGKQYEGVFITPEWRDFEFFVKDNYFRYYRAKIKWENYTRKITRDHLQGKLKNTKVWFIRYKKELGYTKENTVFTNPSDATKNASNTHKYMFEDKLLGTRDILNILRKRGINITMETITNRLNAGLDLFAPMKNEKIRWKGKYRSYSEIAEIENIGYNTLKQKYYEYRDIKEAITIAKQTEPRKLYIFEGKELLQIEICKILEKRTGIKYATISNRFTKYGLDLEKLIARKGYKGYGSTAIKVIAKKDGKMFYFNSIGDAAKELNLHNPLITAQLKGRIAHTGGYTFQYQTT